MSRVANSSTKPLPNTAPLLLLLLVAGGGLPASDSDGDVDWNACTTAAAFGVVEGRVRLPSLRGSPLPPFSTFRAKCTATAAPAKATKRGGIGTRIL
jgi:hypothetical protein